MKNKAGRTSRSSFEEIFEGSAVMRFSKKIYNLFFSGFFGTLLTSYSRLQRKFASGAVARYTCGSSEAGKDWNSSLISRARRAVIREIEGSRIIGALSRLPGGLLSVYLRTFGFFFMYFGLSAAVVNVVRRVAFGGEPVLFELAVSVALVLIALPLLVSKVTLGWAIDSSVFLSKLTYGYLGFSPSNVASLSGGKGRSSGYFRSALAGTLAGCLGFAVSPLVICAVLMASVLGMIIFARPVAGLFAAVLAAPLLSFSFRPAMVLGTIVIYTVLCTALKIFLGRAAVSLEIADIFVMLFMAVLLMGGAVSLGGPSLGVAVMYVCLMGVYFLTVILVRSREDLAALQMTLVISGTVAAVMGLLRLIPQALASYDAFPSLFENISGELTVTAGNARMPWIFLVSVFPFGLSLMITGKTRSCRVLGFTSCALIGGCVLLSGARGDIAALIFAAMILVLLQSHRILPLILPAGLLSLTLLWDRLGGDSFFRSLPSKLAYILTRGGASHTLRVSTWRGTAAVIRENLLCGVGVGSEAFRGVYLRFAEAGAFGASHAGNLYLQILAEVGIIGFAVFLASVFLCVQSGLETVRFGGVKISSERTVCVAALGGLAAMLLRGFTEHIWYNFRVFFIFWLLAATVRTASAIGRKYSKT